MSGLVALMLTLTLQATAAAETTTASPTPAPPAMMFVLDVGGDHVPLPTREALTEAMALALARRLDLEVQSPRSLLDRVDFAQQQQQAGCDSSACMAEIANAMGARFVVFSRIVRLGDEENLRADIYDNVGSRTLALASVRARAVDDLHRQLPTLVEALVRESTGALPLRAVERPIAVATDTPMSSTARAGYLVGGVGLGAAVVFGTVFGLGTASNAAINRAADAYAADPDIDNARALIDARGPFDDTTRTLGTCGSGCLGVGGLLALLIGAGLVGADALAPSAEEATR
jgi:hypothetical protein